MKFRVLILAIVALVAGTLIYYFQTQNAENADVGKTIYIASIVEIQPIADLKNGFRASIKDSSIGEEVTFIEKNAQGDSGLMAQISSEISRTKPDLVYVLGTPLAQIIQNENPNVILVQGAVTDPVEAGLADSWKGSGRNYAANSDRPPVSKMIELAKTLFPKANTIGVIYNPGETNSVSIVNDLKAEKGNFEILEFGAASATDLTASITAAVSRSDLIIVPPDNLVTSGIDALLRAAKKRGKPVFATTEDALEKGALAVVTTGFEQLGREAGEIAISILINNQDPSKMPIKLPDDIELLVSENVAIELGLTLTPDQEKLFKLVR